MTCREEKSCPYRGLELQPLGRSARKPAAMLTELSRLLSYPASEQPYNIIRIFWQACWTQYWYLMAVVLTTAASLQTVPAVCLGFKRQRTPFICCAAFRSLAVGGVRYLPPAVSPPVHVSTLFLACRALKSHFVPTHKFPSKLLIVPTGTRSNTRRGVGANQEARVIGIQNSH
jgi:hypothetical protein